jgi:hypothetical protein
MKKRKEKILLHFSFFLQAYTPTQNPVYIYSHQWHERSNKEQKKKGNDKKIKIVLIHLHIMVVKWNGGNVM